MTDEHVPPTPTPPNPSRHQKMVFFQFKLEPELLDAIRALAAANHDTQSSMVRRLLREALGQRTGPVR